ncbi:hypothetical protein SBA3_520024 [Candidatus Sulfopaludibacter sp. SbA3]|nr:hypothetical protein SBA3_520024 [Candidatus Sulfopaludibacter sp. SbA3]
MTLPFDWSIAISSCWIDEMLARLHGLGLIGRSPRMQTTLAIVTGLQRPL